MRMNGRMNGNVSQRPLLEDNDRKEIDEIEMRMYHGQEIQIDECQDESVRESAKLEFDKKCLMSDGRQIDYVLAYEVELPGTTKDISSESTSDTEEESRTDAEKESNIETGRRQEPHMTHAEKRARRRYFYMRNLKKMGLELEEIPATIGNTRYCLVHAPFDLLEKQAQLLSVKLPVKRSDVEVQSQYDRLLELIHLGVDETVVIREDSEKETTINRRERTVLPGFVDRWLNRMQLFDFDEKTNKLLNEPDYFTAPYAVDRRKQFVNHFHEDLLFPNAERSRMVFDLLIRARYDDNKSEDESQYRVGIERLLASQTFTAAYPLHQEFRSRNDMKDEELTQRELLYTKWASWRNFYKYQPLDMVKRYFGSKVALYFTWLGYYTKSLYPAAILGVVCVLYGWHNIQNDPISNDICNNYGIGSEVLICPNCDHPKCDFQYLNNSCVYSKVSYLFDNGATVIFAALMCVWATLFLEGWKRYHAEVAWKWGLLDFVVEEDTVRPEFQYRVKTKRFNPVSQKEEPYLSTGKIVKNCLASGATVMFFICLVLAVVFGVMVYRVIAMRILTQWDSPSLDSLAFIIVSSSAAFVNLLVIMSMNYVYNRLAHWLTRWECPRTQADFDNSYTFKVFLFQFVNYYSSLFYIAFFKGAFTQIPGESSKIFGIRLEACDSAGCFAELVIQLSIIMCGKQFFSAFMETLYPKMMGRFRKWMYFVPGGESAEKKAERKIQETVRKERPKMSRWEVDYYLSPVYDQFLFDEYLEMVLQFGFVTLFVAAFPLAPLFAVLNNIMEIRLDAYKFLASMQRPTPAQAKNIGVWLVILDGISKISVTINALVIAFTSDFVPKLVWYIKHESLTGYMNSSLSYYPTTEFKEHRTVLTQVPDMCRYRGYREFPCSYSEGGSVDFANCQEAPNLSMEWWYIFAARLLFVVVFEHIVFVIKSIIAYLIPDIPTKIFIQQQREKYLARQALLQNSGSKLGRGDDNEDSAYQPGSDFTSSSTATTILKAPAGFGNGKVPLAPCTLGVGFRKSTSDDSFETCPGGSQSDLGYTKF